LHFKHIDKPFPLQKIQLKLGATFFFKILQEYVLCILNIDKPFPLQKIQLKLGATFFFKILQEYVLSILSFY
jgi:predicted DNA-binding antitoxin AbrB/MazE fold protein